MLIRCPGCGNLVSRKAPACPHCGHPVNPPKKAMGCLTQLILLLGAGFCLFLVCSSWLFSSLPKDTGVPSAEVRASRQRGIQLEKVYADTSKNPILVEDIVSNYHANEINADARFKNRIVCARGTTENIGKDIAGTPYIAFRAPASSFRTVQCMFDDESVLLNIRPGVALTICGECKGLMINVLLDNCRIMN